MNNQNKYHYFYKITNNINGHFYYGVHNTNNLDDGYMGSGKLLHRAYKKYGIENFTKQILKYFDTSKQAFEYEAEVVNEDLVNDPNCYNISIGGNGNIGFISTNKIVAKDNFNNILFINKDDFRYLSGELVGIVKGYVNVKDKNNNYYHILKNDHRYLSGELVGITKGKVPVKDKNGNKFLINTNDPRYLSGELQFIWKGKKHSNETKQKYKETFKKINHQQGEKNSMYGRCWIHNNFESKSIDKNELQQWLDDGWIKGRKMKF